MVRSKTIPIQDLEATKHRIYTFYYHTVWHVCRSKKLFRQQQYRKAFVQYCTQYSQVKWLLPSTH